VTRGRVHVAGGQELAEGWQARQHSAGGFSDEMPKLLKGESVINSISYLRATLRTYALLFDTASRISLYRSRIVNTWGFDMDDLEAVIEQATDAVGTPPEAPAEAPKLEVKKVGFDMDDLAAIIEQATDAVGTSPEAPGEAPKPEVKKVGQAAKKVARKVRPKKKVGKKAKTSAKKSAKQAPKKAKAKKKAKKAKR